MQKCENASEQKFFQKKGISVSWNIIKRKNINACSAERKTMKSLDMFCEGPVGWICSNCSVNDICLQDECVDCGM